MTAGPGPVCVICGKQELIKPRLNPEIPRCRKHRNYRHRIDCEHCGTVRYLERPERMRAPLCGTCSRAMHQPGLRDKDERVQYFFGRAKTEPEIKRAFGSLDVLKRRFDGYHWYAQRNWYGEQCWILLPEIEQVVAVKSKCWKFHRGKDDDGTPQPYLLVQLPEKVFTDGCVKLAPVFDVHYGHSAHREEKLLSYLRWIAEEPNVFAVLGGDLLENALDDNRGMSYDQDKSPTNQVNEMIQLLAPIAHKVLVSVPGNHEWRTYKRAGIDPLRLICERLEIPYFDGPVFLSVLGAGRKWTLHIAHGRGNSQTKGGKLNAAQMAKRFTGLIHVFLSGHVHDPIVNNETCVVEDPISCRLVYLQQWTVIAQSFLGWEGTYAYRAGYPPPGRGGVCIELFANGEYRAVLQ